MERSYPSQEVNTFDFPWGHVSSGDCHNIRKKSQGGHFYGDGNFSPDVATSPDLFIETLVKINRSSSSYKDNELQRCNVMNGSKSSPSEPHEATLHEQNGGIKESILDFDKMPETQPQVKSKQSSSTQTENTERLYRSWLTNIYNWISCNSSLSNIFAMLMVGDGMNSPQRTNQIPRIFLTSPGGHERRLSPLSPRKSPIRSPRESIERIKAFPKIPKRQFTSPEKSPEKKQQPLGAWNRQTSIRSTTATSIPEEMPCCGFRLPPPSKVARPPRDFFSIPETFQPAPSNIQPFDFTKDPEFIPFPSLMFKPVPDKKPQDGDKDASQPSSNVDASQLSSDVCHQRGLSVTGVADEHPSSSTENDKQLPDPLSNPESKHSPHHSTGEVGMPLVEGCSKNLSDELGVDCQLDDSLQQPIQDAMKEFDNVYGKYSSNLDEKLAMKLRKMEEFIAKVRRRIIHVTDIGAIVYRTYIPAELTNAMARINKATYKLKLIKDKIVDKNMRLYSVYTDLKNGPLTTYQSEKETSRLDDLNALRTGTQELRDMYIETTKIVESYRTDKKYVEDYVFG